MSPDHTLVIDLDRPRQWAGELLVIVADPDDDGARARVLMRPHYCREPRCQCSEVRFARTELSVSVTQVHQHGDEVELELDDGRRVRPTLESPSVWLDLPTGDGGKLVADEDQEDEEASAAEDAKITAEFAEMFDGETLDELWRRHGLARGIETSTLSGRLRADYRKGELCAWNEVCQGARPDVYINGGRAVVAIDYYCPTPGCDCNTAHLVFDDNATSELGSVRMSFKTGELSFEAGNKRSERGLREAWDAYVERWPGFRERLHARYLALREALHDAVLEHAGSMQPRRRGEKIGRNQPCPCGSGRKYKRCCGAA